MQTARDACRWNAGGEKPRPPQRVSTKKAETRADSSLRGRGVVAECLQEPMTTGAEHWEYRRGKERPPKKEARRWKIKSLLEGVS